MSTLSSVELGVLGPLQVRQFGLPVPIPGAKPRAILTMLGLYPGAVVPGDALVELLWGLDPPRTAAKAVQTHISALRRALGDGFVLTQGIGWTLNTAEIDVVRYTTAAREGREAAAAGDTGRAVTRFDEALKLWRGVPELPDGRRGATERTRWAEEHAALVEDRADALLATGRAAELIGELEAGIADAPLRERRWGQLMLALYRAGRQGEALAAYQRVRALLADELGVDPGPDLRRLESKIVAQDISLELPIAQHVSAVTRAVTFLLTDIEGSTAAWEADAAAMAEALARHDEIVEQVVTFRGGRLIKTRGEGDATFSVFDRPSGAAAAAVELQQALGREPWALAKPMRIRIALHTGEVEFRDGDYFGRAVNRVARLRSLALGGQTLCSGATAELVIDSLADDVVLADLGMRQLKNLARPEHVFELRLETAGDLRTPVDDTPTERPDLPAVLVGHGPFVGRGRELERLLSAWQTTQAAGACAVLIAGEPGVGKTRLAGEWSRQAFDLGCFVLYGRCDEDLGAPYQPFAEALRALAPCLGTNRLRGMRGVEALLSLVPGLADVLPDLTAPPRADADTERYALFDAVVGLLGTASAIAPIVLVLDDLHWAAKPTLLLLRHLLRFGEHARVQIVGTYRSTDLDRSHPLAAMMADLHRDGSAHRLALGGLGEDDVSAYVTEAGYDDEELARALASVTGGNPFFLIEALRHVDESGGHWDPSTLPQGVREAVSRRLSRLPAETNRALAAAAVVGSRFTVELVERVVEQDLVDAFDEACKAGILIEEPGGRYRFNHALVRQSLLAELASVRRMRLHQRIATVLESEPNTGGELLAELAYHYFECAWAGNAAKAVDYCRRAADQAMAGLAYEGAADLYDKALHALEELDEELSDREDQQAELLVARCEALLAAGDVVSATGAVAQLRSAAADSDRLAAWGTCFDGQLSMLTDPERLDQVESAVGAAAATLAELGDAAGEAKAHTVRAGCLARLGRIGDCETALDEALTAARRAREHRRVNAVLAGAPLAALWGPNPVPRAGGRCLDVVRLLRITTGSPVVEATSTRCQGVLDALRGRASAGRQLIDSARRTLNELGMRHAVLEVEQFAGIVELIADDAAAAERHLRKAYSGFRRMGLDADTAETAALLARACLMLDRDAEAAELCTESEHLAGHAFKAAIAWRTVRAQLLSRNGEHGEARRVAEEAVAIAERTDALVDHGDACLTLAMVLRAAGDAAGARVAAERAVGLYEAKGAAALVEKARHLLGVDVSAAQDPAKGATVHPENVCMGRIYELDAAIALEEWGQVERLLTPDFCVESRRKIVGFPRANLQSVEYMHQARRCREQFPKCHHRVVVAVRGQRVALTRVVLHSADEPPGGSKDEMLQLFGLDESDRIAHSVWFDVEDRDAALAELGSLHARLEAESARPSVENTASRVEALCYALFEEGRIDDIGTMLTPDHRNEDRRSGLGRESNDRDAALDNIRVISALGATITCSPIALRGERLCLSQIVFEKRDTEAGGFRVETLELTELDDAGVMRARVVFDVEDFDAAMAELDARYLAGEAAPYAHAWSAVADAYAAFNRREIAATSPGWVNVDHRRGTAFAPGDMTAYLSAAWADSPDTRIYVDAVHRLSEHGAVVTHAAKGIAHAGFEAEWRDVNLLTLEGDLINRSELFGAEDLDRALVRFDQLSCPAPRIENAASLAYERLWHHFYAGDWDGVTAVFAEDISNEDRRRVVNAGLERGRDVQLANLRRIAEIGATVSSTILATRGQHLVLNRVHASNSDLRSGEFDGEMINVIETDSDGRIAAGVLFDRDDVGAAFAELDSRYLAGEAAPHARTWSIISQAYAGMTRGEIPGTTAGLVNIDHRHVAPMAADEGIAYLQASWDLAPEFSLYIEAVHRLSDLGAVFTRWSKGTSRDGFAAEWRAVDVITVEGDLISRGEIFDESDLEVALARFDELSRPAVLLANGASREYHRFNTYYTTGDWEALAKTMADDFIADDRRRFVGSGGQQGRNAAVDDARVTADLGVRNATSTVVATRGHRLALMRTRYWGRDERPDAFSIEVLHMVEIDAARKITMFAAFDLDDFDAAVTELDARYLAGEAAVHATAWSVVKRNVEAFNRHELHSFTPDMVNVDHRRMTAFAPGDQAAYVRATWEQTPDLTIYIEEVHRLNDLGAVFSYVARGTTAQAFQAEWRGISLSIIEGDLIRRSERFGEEDLDGAVLRFDELSHAACRLENAASRMYKRYNACFVARDWAAMAELAAEDVCTDDRRRVVSGGIQRGRTAQTASMRAAADVGVRYVESSVIAIRGDRLALIRARVSGAQRPEAFGIEVLTIVEVDTHGRCTVAVLFDLDDTDAAVAELELRYLAGEAAPHAQTWSVVTQMYSALNRRELPAATSGWVAVDHQRGRAFTFGVGEIAANIQDSWAQLPSGDIQIAAVHRLSGRGAVVTHAAHGTSQDGLEAEWRCINVLVVDRGLIDRCELFDEVDLEAALARFDELNHPLPRLKSAVSHWAECFHRYFMAHDWPAIRESMADGFTLDDRRRTVNAGIRHGRDAEIEDLRAAADVGFTDVTWVEIATRGRLLALARVEWFGREQRGEAFRNEWLGVVEIDADGRAAALVMLDTDDFDAAFQELDARYLAGEAAPYANTWSRHMRAYAAVNKQELPEWSRDWVNADHRRSIAYTTDDMAAYVQATFDEVPDVKLYVEAVHRLSKLGVVVTHVVKGTSRQGFVAEWREIVVATVGGDQTIHSELFDETDLDAALVCFEGLSRTTHLDNATIRVGERVRAAFAARNWDGMAELFAEDLCNDDRRQVVNGGIRHGRDSMLEDMRAAADLGVPCFEAIDLATRGERLALFRGKTRYDERPGAFLVENLVIAELDADGRIAAEILFDADDMEAAVTELDTRYTAGEAAPYGHIWSLVTQTYAAFNRHELSKTTPDWVDIDHRLGVGSAPGDMNTYVSAMWTVVPDVSTRIEAVHRLNNLGAVFTHTESGTSHEGFDAEWREVALLMFDGDAVNRCELFDETDLEAAIARFDELSAG